MSQLHTATLMYHKIISQLDVTVTNKQTTIMTYNKLQLDVCHLNLVNVYEVKAGTVLVAGKTV